MVEAYPTDAAYLQDQVRRMELIIERRLAQREQRAAGRAQPGRVHEIELALHNLEQEIAARVANTEAAGRTLAFERLVADYHLDSFERDLLTLALAPSLDLHFADLMDKVAYKYRGRSVDTALTILCDSVAEKVAARRYFMLDATLIKHHLILMERDRWRGEEDILSLDLKLPRRVLNLVLGADAVDESLVSFSKLIEPVVDLSQVVLPEEQKRRVLRLVSHHAEFLRKRSEWGFDRVIGYGRGIILLFTGAPGTGKTMLANALAKHLGKRLLLVNTDRLYDRVHTFESNVDNLFREAKLQNSLLFFDECEMLFSDRRLGNGSVAELLTALERFDGIAILATNLAPALDEAMDRRILLRIDFEMPSTELREEIWRHHLPPEAPLATDVDVRALAETFEFTGGYIKNAVLAALHEVLSRREDHPRIRQEDLLAACRMQLRQRLTAYTDRVVPQVSLDQVILPDDLKARVREIVDAARQHALVFGVWGLGKRLSIGRGVSALLQGQPGTGKTLTAEAIAYELAKNLFQVSLPAVVSKFVGETEKNLKAVFQEATAGQCVLFFDEADALFARRTDVQGSLDRYANMEVNLLLQELEKFDGLVLLATNLVGNLDRALERRLTYRLTFPFPDAQARAAIWRSLIPPQMPVTEIDFDYLANRYELSGGQIKNAVVRAAYRAAREPEERRFVTTPLLARAAEEEITGGFTKKIRPGFAASSG